MIIVAFAENTSKILPRILCRKLRHCAPIICNNNDLIMYQFINHNHITAMHLRTRDIAILHAHGWHFVYIPSAIIPDKFYPKHTYSCVAFTKQAIKIKSFWIQTPYALYKHLTRK